MIPSGTLKSIPFFTDGGNCFACFGGAGGGDTFTGAGFGGESNYLGGGGMFDDLCAGAVAFGAG
jgi:hypothetical protein